MNELELQLKPLLEEFVESTVGLAKSDFQTFAKDITQDFASFLYRAHVKGEEEVEKDLSHLRAQVKLLAVKHRINVTKELADKLAKALSVVASIALRTLNVSLPT